MLMNQKYPQYVYNAKGETKVVSNDTELTQLKLQGYNAKYVHSHFPKMLFGPKGESKTVNNEAEFQSAKDAGFGEDFVPVPEPPKEEVKQKQKSEASDALIRVLLAENRDLAKRLDAVEEILSQLAPADEPAAADEPAKEAEESLT